MAANRLLKMEIRMVTSKVLLKLYTAPISGGQRNEKVDMSCDIRSVGIADSEARSRRTADTINGLRIDD